MRPNKHKTTGSNDLFRARLDQIINLKHELVLLAGKIDWDWIDGEIYNFRRILAWLRNLLRFILAALIAAISFPSALQSTS
jgi:IS5 family transposase